MEKNWWGKIRNSFVSVYKQISNFSPLRAGRCIRLRNNMLTIRPRVTVLQFFDRSQRIRIVLSYSLISGYRLSFIRVWSRSVKNRRIPPPSESRIIRPMKLFNKYIYIFVFIYFATNRIQLFL